MASGVKQSSVFGKLWKRIIRLNLAIYYNSAQGLQDFLWEVSDPLKAIEEKRQSFVSKRSPTTFLKDQWETFQELILALTV